MFKPMKKIVKIGDTGVEIEFQNTVEGELAVRINGYLLSYLLRGIKRDKKLIAALGFPTEPIEEIEEIEGVIE